MIGCFPNQFTKDVKTRKKSQYLHIIWGEGNVSNWYDSYITSVAGVTVNGIAPEHATETTQFLKYPVSVSGNTHVDWVVFLSSSLGCIFDLSERMTGKFKAIRFWYVLSCRTRQIMSCLTATTIKLSCVEPLSSQNRTRYLVIFMVEIIYF